MTRHRLQLDLNDGGLTRLDDIVAATESSTRAEAVRKALKLLEWLVDERNSGAKVQAIRPDGSIVEPVLI